MSEITVTASEAARILGVSRQRVHQLQKAGVFSARDGGLLLYEVGLRGREKEAGMLKRGPDKRPRAKRSGVNPKTKGVR